MLCKMSLLWSIWHTNYHQFYEGRTWAYHWILKSSIQSPNCRTSGKYTWQYFGVAASKWFKYWYCWNHNNTIPLKCLFLCSMIPACTELVHKSDAYHSKHHCFKLKDYTLLCSTVLKKHERLKILSKDLLGGIVE